MNTKIFANFFEKIFAILYLGTVYFEKRSGIIWVSIGLLRLFMLRKL